MEMRVERAVFSDFLFAVYAAIVVALFRIADCSHRGPVKSVCQFNFFVSTFRFVLLRAAAARAAHLAFFQSVHLDCTPLWSVRFRFSAFVACVCCFGSTPYPVSLFQWADVISLSSRPPPSPPHSLSILSGIGCVPSIPYIFGFFAILV